MSETKPTPPRAEDGALQESELETAAGGGILDDAVNAVKDFFGVGEKKTTFGGGSSGGGGASGSW